MSVDLLLGGGFKSTTAYPLISGIELGSLAVNHHALLHLLCETSPQRSPVRSPPPLAK